MSKKTIRAINARFKNGFFQSSDFYNWLTSWSEAGKHYQTRENRTGRTMAGNGIYRTAVHEICGAAGIPDKHPYTKKFVVESGQFKLTAVQYHPDEFEYLTGQILPFGVSYIKDERLMREQGVRVVMVGMGDWAFDVPKKMIFVSTGIWQFDGIAHTRREPKGFLLTEEEYQTAETYGATGYKKEGQNWQPYERDETFYTWDAYTKATGNPRYK